MWSTAFLKAIAERAIKTFCQTEAALLTAGATGLLDTDWQASLSISGMAAAVSVLTSVATGAITDGGPSVGDVEKLPPT